ncbi:MAG: hypothetical protein FJW34_24320, partial [Acidobacteria bacterium]|nr:hypothetical protein [Acidobacteriota bacterium]
MEWYHWRNVCATLVTFGRAIQGVSPYTVAIEPDAASCPTGYCDYARRRIAVNPTLFPGRPPKEQYALTRGLLVHEAGHRRFTSPGDRSGIVGLVTNCLEDQRVERLMSDSFAGLRPLVTFLSQVMYAAARPLDRASDSPGQVLAAILQARWAESLGEPLKGELSPRNQGRWQEVFPLARDAWSAPDTATVEGLARRIVEILGLSEEAVPDWVRDLQDRLGGLIGQRDGDDPAERPWPVTEAATGPQTEPLDQGLDALPSGEPAGAGRFAIEPQPYMALVEMVQPQVQELLEELSLAQAPARPEMHSRGSRLSIRQVLRHPDEPFLVESDHRRRPLTMTFRVVVDHSTSMNLPEGRRETRMAGAAAGAMMLHLFALEAGIEHQIAVTPQGVRLADLASGERGLALIAGLVPGLTWWEDMGKAIETQAAELVERPE